MEWVKIHYLDASSLVKLFVDEEGAGPVREYFNRESGFRVTSLCFAETLGVLKSKFFYQKKITQENYLCACDELMSSAADETILIVEVPISDTFSEVESLVRKYSIDTSDAFQIVTIKRDYFSKFPETQPILITADETLANAARHEGLKVWDCLREPPPPEQAHA